MVKQLIGKIHLWLGLISSIIVFIVSVTGCLFVFQKEITNLIRHDAIYTTQQTSSPIPASQAFNKVKSHLAPGQKINWAIFHNSPDKNNVFYTYQGTPDAVTYFSAINYYQSFYADPFSGAIKASYNEKYNFFNLVKNLHWSLLLSTKIGQPIVGWGTLIFVVLLITGLVLWWPKNFKSSQRLFRFQWNKKTSWKRKIYDLHNILGFYSLVWALIISLTGMVWAFKWFQTTVYVLASGTTNPPDRSMVQSTPASYQSTFPLDVALETAREKYPDAAAFRLIPPADSLASISIYIQQKEGRYDVSHSLLFDQYSGKLLKERQHNDKNRGEKLITANYDIHTGAILGFPGKILAFVVSLICASLPVTGFLMWRNKLKKHKKPLLL